MPRARHSPYASDENLNASATYRPGGGSTTRSTAVLVTLILLLASLGAVLPASAGHRLLEDAGIDTPRGATKEDDGIVVHAPGNILDGRANRVVQPGSEAGDGGLFLDARVLQRIGAMHTEPGTDFDAGLLAGPLLGRSDVLFPYARHTTAWFGWWNDLDGDGFIDDDHDAACDASILCPEDEFRWKGAGSGAEVNMIQFVVPGSYRPPNVSGGVESFHGAGNPHGAERMTMRDFTGLGNAEQDWRGAFSYSVDGGFLATIHTVVVADARPLPGHALRWDLDDPAAHIDVDRYEALSPDAEALYVASLRFALEEADPAPIVAAVGDIYARSLAEHVTPLAQLASDGVQDAQRITRNLVGPPDAKEPNHADDDYEDRARFGGVGDPLGTGNSYPGYLDGFHFYFDNVARTGTCVGVSGRIAAGVNANPVFNCVTQSHDPHGGGAAAALRGAGGEGARSAGTFLVFRGSAYLWHDKNADTHLGAVCDPTNPDEFDAAANGCRTAPHPWPHSSNSNEVLDVCGATRVGAITLHPLGGAWPDVFVVRDTRESDGILTGTSVTVRSDSAPIELRWKESCALDSRDAVYFPRGIGIDIRVESEASLDSFNDAAQDIIVIGERVLDVDVLRATM